MSVVPRRVRIVIATLVSVFAVGGLLLFVVRAFAVAGSWAGLYLTCAFLIVWAMPKIWIVVAPLSPGLWLKHVHELWRWARRDDTPRPAPPLPPRQHTAFDSDHGSTRRW
ncbi:hypothetical protein [Cellulomonas sp. P5_C5]